VQRVASFVVGSSQFVQRNATEPRQPMATNTGPATVPTGYQNISRKPPISRIKPGTEVTRRFCFVAMVCSFPGSITEFAHSGQFNSVPAA
jgi:hypothetical protein